MSANATLENRNMKRTNDMVATEIGSFLSKWTFASNSFS